LGIVQAPLENQIGAGAAGYGGGMNTEATSYFPGASSSSGICVKKAGASLVKVGQAGSRPTTSVTAPVRKSIRSSQSETVGATDEELFEQLHTGCKEALAVLFRRYARVVRAVGLRILRDGAEADDLVQEVFLFVYRKCNLFDAARGSARSWIVQVAYHRAIDRRRYLASRHFYTRLELSDTATLVNGTPYEGSLEGVLGKGRLEHLYESLTGDQQRVLELYFYEGYTLEEIAREMEQTVGNVRNHYYRGLEKMRAAIFGRKLRVK